MRGLQLDCNLSTRSLSALPKQSLESAIIASSFDFQYLHLSLKSSNSCLRLLPCLPVPSIIPSITHFRRQFLSKMWQRAMNGQAKCWSFQLMSNLHKTVNRSAKNATPLLLAESHINTYIRLLLLIIYVDSSMVHLLCWWSLSLSHTHTHTRNWHGFVSLKKKSNHTVFLERMAT
jgi:hypothetical protein